MQSELTNLTLDKQKVSHTNYTSRTMNQFTRNNSKYRKLIKLSLKQHLMNGSNFEWLKEQIPSTTHHCFVCPKNKAEAWELYKISEN